MPVPSCPSRLPPAAVCACLAARDYYWGWPHRGREGSRQDSNRLSGSGTAAVAMCVGYMWTGMSGLWEFALPTNPGAVFKHPNVAFKSRVWEQWGYGQVYMRG